MKILCEFSPGGSTYVRSGWGRVFQYCGHDFRWWKPNQKSIHDAFHDFEPDILLSCTYSVDRAMVKCIEAHKDKIKVALFASAWGPMVDKLDREKYPIVIVSDEEKRIIENLKKTTGLPNFVFIHVTDKYLMGTMGGWRSIGVEPIGVLNAADILVYSGAKWRPELACDVGYIGGRWPFKARNIDQFLLPLCHPNSGLKVKIFGNTVWPVGQYLGPCSDETARDLFVSATVCPNISEPHSTDLNFDCVERPLKVFAAGGFCISDYVDEWREIYNDEELLMCRTPGDFCDTIKHFVSHPDDRLPYIVKAKSKTYSSHTYFDRVSNILEHLGMDNESGLVMVHKSECLKTIGVI